MIVLGLFVVVRFTEHNFTPTEKHRLRESVSIFRRGVRLARRDNQLLVVFAATFLVNGAAEGYEFLLNKQLLELGISPDPDPDPIVWVTALGLATLATGAIALRIIEARIDDAGVARRTYTAASFAGALGVIVLAHAPSAAAGVAGVLFASGIAWPVTRTVGEIWANRRATSDVHATV